MFLFMNNKDFRKCKYFFNKKVELQMCRKKNKFMFYCKMKIFDD